MASFAQIMTDVGNAIEAARNHVTAFEQNHITLLRTLATQAEDLIAASATGGPETMVVDLVATALDDLKAQMEKAFVKPPPAPVAADPLATDVPGAVAV